MADYRFTTIWKVEAACAPVFDVILDSCNWPRWWAGVESVEELAAGNPDGTGNVRRYVWKGYLPYRLCFSARSTCIVPPREIGAEVSGDVEGSGRWLFTSEGGTTTVRYQWHVRTEKWWMNLLAPLAKPVFRHNHHLLMERGARGLATVLAARLIEVIHCDDP